LLDVTIRTSFLATAMVAYILLGGIISPAPAAEDPWQPFRFLIGEWVSVGDPTKGTGAFTLLPDLQDKILVRKNHAEIPASPGRPAAAHDDLMIIYRPDPGAVAKAVYFDNEGHVIHYATSVSADKRALIFLSDPATGAPRFRLTYTKGDDDTVAIKFEIAAPNAPDSFKTYLEGKVRRKAAR
jgi:hypothetical protein